MSCKKTDSSGAVEKNAVRSLTFGERLSRPRTITGRLLLLLLFGPLPLEAQETSRGGFHLTAPLSLSYGRERKLRAGSRLIDDSVSVLAPPAISLTGKSLRNDFSLEYKPDFELFLRNRDLNAWNHDASLRYSYKLTRRATLELGDYFLETQDASRKLENSFFLLPRGRFQENSAYFGLGYRFSPHTTLDFRLDNTVTKVRLPEMPHADLLDQMSSSGSVSLSRDVSRRQRLTARYSFSKFRALAKQEDPLVAPSSRPHHSGSLVYTYTFDPNFFLELSGGAIHGRTTSYSASARLERRMRGFRVAAGYQRQLSVFGGIRLGGGLDAAPGFATGLLPSSLSEAVTLTFRGNIGNRVGIEGAGMGARTRSGDSSPELKSLAGHLRLDYKLTERLIAFSTVGIYRQNVSVLLNTPLERTRYFGGVEILLSKPRKREDSPPNASSEETGGNP